MKGRMESRLWLEREESNKKFFEFPVSEIPFVWSPRHELAVLNKDSKAVSRHAKAVYHMYIRFSRKYDISI